MTNSADKDEFREIREMLASAARYSESAHLGLDRLEAAQQRWQMQCGQPHERLIRVEAAVAAVADSVNRFTQRSTQISEEMQTMQADFWKLHAENNRILDFLLNQDEE